jgi:uncharacterized protein (PEP-CTERM system associated)
VIGASFGQDNYENEIILDNEFDTIQFGFERTVSPLLIAGMDLRLTNRDFQNVVQKDEDTIVAFFVDRSFGRKLSLNFSYQRLERDGTNTAAYEENIVQVMLQFTPRPAASVL